MRRGASQERDAEDTPGCMRMHVPVAVPRGCEVCGGAPVGVDVAAALRPCVEQVLTVVLESDSELEAGGHGVVLAALKTPSVGTDPAFAQRLSDLRACLAALAGENGRDSSIEEVIARGLLNTRHDWLPYMCTCQDGSCIWLSS